MVHVVVLLLLSMLPARQGVPSVHCAAQLQLRSLSPSWDTLGLHDTNIACIKPDGHGGPVSVAHTVSRREVGSEGHLVTSCAAALGHC
jgi:hypothetical protein